MRYSRYWWYISVYIQVVVRCQERAHPTQAMYTYSNNRQLELEFKLKVRTTSS